MKKKKLKEEEVINPLDFFDFDEEQKPPVSQPARRRKVNRRDAKPSRNPQAKKQQAIFITGTDTEVGKTVAACTLGVLLREQGVDIGIMKPVQCGGHDAKFLQEVFKTRDAQKDVNPYFATKPLSPHIAFAQEKKDIQIQDIVTKYQKIKSQHDLTLVEGAGGLLAPIKPNFLMADLVRELGCEIVIVSRLGLGTINHTLLTIRQAQAMGLTVKGVIFNESRKTKHGVAEQTNPEAVASFGQVPVLGIIPFLGQVYAESAKKNILSKCNKCVDIKPLLPASERQSSSPWGQWDKDYVWHPFTQMQEWLQEEPLIISQAKGTYLEDTEGRKYIDGVSSLWVNVHGHGHEEINQRLRQQLSCLEHSSLLGLSNTPAIALAKRLVDIVPPGLKKVFFSDNGSTAVEVAIKMAYQYWQNQGHRHRTQIAHLSNSYHGDTLGSVSVGGIDLFHKAYNKLIIKSVTLEFPDFYRAPKGKVYPAYTEECLKNMERVFQKQGRQIAALVIEPIVQGAAGITVWPEGVLSRISQLCKKFGIFLIADEVATGFGRTGKMFACEHEKVVPDFLCLAKGLTGGYLPLAATLTTKQVFDGFLFDYKEQKTFFHGHTYTGNPLCCAAALASLDVFEKEQTIARLQRKIGFLGRALNRFRDLAHVGDIRQKGFMVGIELVQNIRSKNPYPWQDKIGVRVCQLAKEQGVILRPLGNVIVIMPPLSILKPEMEQLLNVTFDAIRTVTEGKKPTAKGSQKKAAVKRTAVVRRK